MNAIDIFPWIENLSTGLPEIDEQHKKLVQILNRLASEVAYRPEICSSNVILDELAAYAIYHFQTEEAIWHRYFAGDALEERHKNSHHGFVKAVAKLKAEQDMNADNLFDGLLSFLTRWLLFHIL
ncbi:MAG: bacteriohemerythrin [Burkholderiales bacterium]